MYAHQVIEDIKKIAKESNNITRGALNELIEVIFSSHKFHCGDIDEIRAMTGGRTSLDNKALFLDSSYMRLPYRTMWIDWTFNRCNEAEIPDICEKLGQKAATNSREAVLVHEHSYRVWEVFCFSYINEALKWVPLLAKFVIFIGGVDDENIDEYYSLINPKTKITDPGGNVFLFKIAGCYPPNFDEVIKAEYALNCELLQRTIKILNCNNIGTLDNKPPLRLNIKREKNDKVPLFTYKTLHIKLPNHKNEYSGNGVSLSHNRIHFCRGHFKEYTAAAPLFGKYTGLYWWEPHVRGQNRDGIVMKDYSVEVSK